MKFPFSSRAKNHKRIQIIDKINCTIKHQNRFKSRSWIKGSSTLEQIWSIQSRKEENGGKNGCNCPKESFTPSSRTFAHNSPPFFAEERNGGTYPWNGRGGEREGRTDTQRSRETRKKSWFASLRNLEMGVCRRRFESAVLILRLDEISFAIVCDRLKKQGKRYFFEEFPSSCYIWRRNWRRMSVCALYVIVAPSFLFFFKLTNHWISEIFIVEFFRGIFMDLRVKHICLFTVVLVFFKIAKSLAK